MALKARISDLAALPEAVRSYYRQDGDGYILEVDPVDGFALEDLTGLKSTLSKQKTEIRALKDNLVDYQVEGGEYLDAKKAKEALKKFAEFSSMDPAKLAEEKTKAAIQGVEAQFTAQLNAKETELKKLYGQLEHVMIDQHAISALATRKGNVKLLLPHVRNQLKLERDGENYRTVVVDGDKNPRVHVANGKAVDMTIDQLIDEMRSSADFRGAFEADVHSGGGTPPTITSRQGGSPRVIQANDQKSLNSSIADIAAGKVQVEL